MCRNCFYCCHCYSFCQKNSSFVRLISFHISQKKTTQNLSVRQKTACVNNRRLQKGKTQNFQIQSNNRDLIFLTQAKWVLEKDSSKNNSKSPCILAWIHSKKKGKTHWVVLVTKVGKFLLLLRNMSNIPTVAGDDALCLRLTGAEQLIVWLILNSTHLLLDILHQFDPTCGYLMCVCNRIHHNQRAFESFPSF